MNTRKAFDIGEDIAQQRLVWRIERIGWSLMALAISASLLGFTGHGPFSARIAGSSDAGFTVAYNRFERYAAPTLLTVNLADPAGSETRLRVSAAFLNKVEVLRVDPEPERIELDSEFLTYVFATSAPGRIVFHYEPADPGSMEIRLGLEEGSVQTLRQFVYP